jgi:hypothetical protein
MPFVTTPDLAQQSLWERLVKQNATPIDNSFNPNANMDFLGLQAEPVINPKFDEATLDQPLRGVQAASPPPGGPAPKAFIIPQAPNPGTARKDNAEKMLYDLIKQSDNTPSLDAQKQSVSDYADKVKAYADKPVGGLQSLNLQPLAALSDAWNPGSKLANSYTAPETPAEHAAKALALQGSAAGLQGALTKEQTDLMKDKLSALVGIDKANKDNGAIQSFMQERMDNMNHERNVMAVKKDPTLIKMQTSSNALTNALANYDNADIKAVPQFQELQQTIRRNLGITGPSDLHERKNTQFSNAGLDMATLKQYLFSSPQDVGESQEAFVDHLRNLVNIQQANTAKQAQARLNTLIKGNASMYAKPENQGKLADLNDLAGATMAQFQPAKQDVKKPAVTPQQLDKYKDMTDDQIKELYLKKQGAK